MSVAADVERQRTYDRERGGHQAALAARVRAVADAQHAHLAGEEGAAEAFRQSLIDTASPAPCSPSRFSRARTTT